MRSRAKLVMIEQIIMILVFALATTVCVRMFVLSERISKESEDADKAVLVAQNVAECLKRDGITAYRQNKDVIPEAEDEWVTYYDSGWNLTGTKADGGFCLKVQELQSENEFLWQARITVGRVNGKEMFCIPVAGQREDGGGGI